MKHFVDNKFILKYNDRKHVKVGCHLLNFEDHKTHNFDVSCYYI